MSTYGHVRHGSGGRRELTIALLLAAVMMIVEFLVGLWTHSLALLADAGHLLTDVSGLGLSLFAAWMATRPANEAKTYGYYRTEILAAFGNGLALWLMVIWIYVRAFQRLQSPVAVESGPMLVVAVLGLGVNLVCAYILKDQRSASLNVQGAWLNVMSDALGSGGVIAAALAMRWFGWYLADPIASLVIGVLIGWSSWSLIRQSVNVLLESAPSHVRLDEVLQAMRAVPGVLDVHDMHVWTITTGMEAMSAHVQVQDLARSDEILNALNGELSRRFGITHTTLQLEPGER